MQITKEQQSLEVSNKNQLYRKVDILTSILEIGSLDFHRAVETLEGVEKETNHNHFGYFLEYLDEQIKYNLVKLVGIDLNYFVYDYLLNEVQNQIQTYYSDNDMDNPDFGDIYVYGNYFCTSFDSTDQAKAAVEKIPDNKRPALVNWFYNQIS
jgi:hypothetical protein